MTWMNLPGWEKEEEAWDHFIASRALDRADLLLLLMLFAARALAQDERAAVATFHKMLEEQVDSLKRKDDPMKPPLGSR